MEPSHKSKPSILNYSDVSRRTGLSRSQIWRLWRAGEFPQPVKLSTKRIGFVDVEVDDWIKSRIEERA